MAYEVGGGESADAVVGAQVQPEIDPRAHQDGPARLRQPALLSVSNTDTTRPPPDEPPENLTSPGADRAEPEAGVEVEELFGDPAMSFEWVRGLSTSNADYEELETDC